MTPDLFFDYLGVRLNAERARDAKIAVNFDFGGNDGKYSVQLENGVLNHNAGAAKKADVGITLSRDTLNSIILQQTKLDDAIKAGNVKVDGDRAKLDQLVSYLDNFKFWFNIVTP